VEHENNLEIADRQWKHIHENVMECAANFFYTDFYKQHVLSGGKDILRIEKLDSFDLDGIKVYARPDVAVKSEDGLEIIDWKTGSEDDEHEFQLCFYAMYGVRKLGIPPEKIRASLVYLRDNTINKAVIDPEKLGRAEEYLKSTYDGIKAFDEDAKQGVEVGALPRAKAKSTCTLCRFQKMCGSSAPPSPR
jgi:CRISPR/Cas system-associated exonuclease Cas4 (RecB family)